MTEHEPVDFVVRMNHGKTSISTEHGAGRLKRTEDGMGREILRITLSAEHAKLPLDDVIALYHAGRLKP